MYTRSNKGYNKKQHHSLIYLNLIFVFIRFFIQLYPPPPPFRYAGISTARAVVAQPTRSGGPYATTAAPAAAPMAAPYSATAYPTSAPTAAVPPPYTPSTSASAYQATAAPVQGGYRTESYGAAMSDEALARKMQMEENANGGGPYASNQVKGERECVCV